jgi:hypothetical protein
MPTSQFVGAVPAGAPWSADEGAREIAGHRVVSCGGTDDFRGHRWFQGLAKR